MLVAVTIGVIAGEIIQRIRIKKGTLYTIILIPFIASPIEQQFKSPTNSYSIVTKVTINARPEFILINKIKS